MIGYLEVLGAVSIWAIFNGYIVRDGETSGVAVGTWTGFWGLLIFGLIFFGTSNPIPILNPSQVTGLILLGTFAALNNVCNYTGIKISMVNTLLFHYLAPLLIPIWALFFPGLGIKIRAIDLVALSIALTGMIWVGVPNLHGNKKWLPFAIGSAFFYSLEIVLSGYVSRPEHLGVSNDIATMAKLAGQVFWMPVVGSLILSKIFPQINFSLGVIKNERSKLFIGSILLYLSFIWYFAGSATVSEMHRGILGYIDRIGAIAIGIIFFHEKITRQAWFGGALILGAGLSIIF